MAQHRGLAPDQDAVGGLVGRVVEDTVDAAHRYGPGSVMTRRALGHDQAARGESGIVVVVEKIVARAWFG
jgi:hypothetical protein